MYSKYIKTLFFSSFSYELHCPIATVEKDIAELL